MPLRRRAWRSATWAAGLLAALLALAALANSRWDFGAKAPGGRFVYWLNHRVEVGNGLDTRAGFIAEQSGAPHDIRDPEFGEIFSDVVIASVNRRRNASLPAWGLPLIPLALAIISARMARFPSGFCPRCFYDLRGLPAGPHSAPVCPECGYGRSSSPLATP